MKNNKILNLNGDITRQLNNIYGLTFNKKYKNEIKERIIYILKKQIFKDVTFDDIELLNEYIELDYFKIKNIKSKFFQEFKSALLEQMNPIWYKEEATKYKATKSEENFFKSVILQVLIMDIENEQFFKDFLEFKNQKNDNFFDLKINKSTYFMSYLSFIKKHKDSNFKYIERKEDIDNMKKEFELQIDIKKDEILDVYYNFGKEDSLTEDMIEIIKNNEFKKIDKSKLGENLTIDIFNLETMFYILEKIKEIQNR